MPRRVVRGRAYMAGPLFMASVKAAAVLGKELKTILIGAINRTHNRKTKAPEMIWGLQFLK